MRYFSVEKEVLDGQCSTGVVERDGGFIGAPDIQDEYKTITTGFSVFEYDDKTMMTEDVKWYGVETDFRDWSNNEEEVLNKIEADHPAGEWQCNEW